MRARVWARPITVALAALILLLWSVNAVWMLSLSAQYGGSALDGHVRDGQYYLAQHGAYTLVSQGIWKQVRLHELGFRFGAPVAFLCFAYLLFTLGFPAAMGLRRGSLSMRACRRYAPLASEWPRGPALALWAV